MVWNWQHDDWPNFEYSPAFLEARERRFLLDAGQFLGTADHVVGGLGRCLDRRFA